MTGPLRAELAGYLGLRRALGYRLERPEKLLNQFLTHLEAGGHDVVSVSEALRWAKAPVGGAPSWWGYRLSVVRGFATYLHAIDPAHEVPPDGLLTYRPMRAVPYLYSQADIASLITCAGSLGTPLRRATMATLIGLLAVTGMRVGEALALDRADVDLDDARLVIRHGKFGKVRQLWLHPSTVAALSRYRQLRDQAVASGPGTASFFASAAGTRPRYCSIHKAFQQMVEQAGLTARSPLCRPRIHDLRHSFAVTAMLDAYAAGQDGQTRLTLLSTWLGHVDPANTYWYLSASPELMAAAAHKLEAHLAGRP